MVVDLPEPAAPTTRISPRRSITRSFSISGSVRSSSFGMMYGMKRITAETVPRCRNVLRRKLPTPCTGRPRFSSLNSSSSRKWASVSRSASRPITCSGSSLSWLTGTHTPLILIVTGEPTEMNRSEAFFSAISWNSLSNAIACFTFVGAVPASLRSRRPEQKPRESVERMNPNRSPAGPQLRSVASRSSSLIPVLARVCASTRLTMTAQYRL